MRFDLGYSESRLTGARSTGRAQVMPLFALMLPVIIALLGLTMSGEIFLNARSRLDAATVVAAIAASGDACMASQYNYNEYECQYGGYTTDYASGIAPDMFPMETSPGILGTPASFSPADWAIVQTEEQQIASLSAEYSVNNVLKQAFPGYTINAAAAPTATQPCEGTESGTGVYTSSQCKAAEQGSSLTNIEFQVQVSSSYMLDGDDPTGGVSDDVGAGGAAQTDAHDSSSGSLYVCPATGLFGRQVTVRIWMQASQPFGVFIGESSILMQSKSTAYGCLGD